MTKEDGRITAIRKKLKDMYPETETQLLHRNPYELLMATILSAQCTDRQVNQVTPALFAAYPRPDAMAEAPLKKIEKLIRSTGFFHNKARHLKNCAAMLSEQFGGKVPEQTEQLVTLPGVGRKTANVVRGAAFGQPAMVVDTHVKRISNRLGLTASDHPDKIERDLMACIPESEWNAFGLRLIYFGRETCAARKPKCGKCALYPECPWEKKNA
ncbi:MAG: endonuclease III [Desulfococcus sp.]|nr:MAG: endonuclease III [Desulfococcus sp.]